MSENDVNSDKTTFKVKIAGEDYHDFVIDWKDTSQPYEQQVFRPLAEMSGIPIERTLGFSWLLRPRRYDIQNTCLNTLTEPKLQTRYRNNFMTQFNKETVSNVMNGEENFTLGPFMHCDDNKHFYIYYCFIPDRVIDETDCSEYFCHHQETRIFLDKYKAIIANKELHLQMKDLLVQPKYPEEIQIFQFRDKWADVYKKFNILQYCYRFCYRLQERDDNEVVIIDMAPQIYSRLHA